MFFQKYQLNLLEHSYIKSVRNVEVYIPTIFMDAVNQNIRNGDETPNMLYHKNLGESALTTLSFDIMEKIENKASDISYIYMTENTLKTIKVHLLDHFGMEEIESITLIYTHFLLEKGTFKLKFIKDSTNQYRMYTLTLVNARDSINHITIVPIIRPLIKSLYEKIRQHEEMIENLQMQLLYMPPGGGEMYHKAKQNFETLTTQ